MSTNFPTTLDSFLNPSATDKLNGSPNPALLHHTQHSNINDSVSALEAKLGINFSNTTTSIDYILQIIEAVNMTHPRGGYKEIVYISNVFPATITWYVDSSKAVTLIQKDFTYGPDTKKFITQIQWKLYDGTVSNIVKRTITDTITRFKVFELNRARVIS